MFRPYMAKEQYIASVGSVDYRHVQAFLSALRNTRIQAYMFDATVKGFFKWCEAQGYSRYNPAKIAGDLWQHRNQ
jgi:site-specific recombinase XerD